MRIVSLALLLVISATLCGCWTADISGTYVGGDSQGAALVQVVQGSDGHLLGRFALMNVKQDGTIQQTGGTADGYYRDQNIVVTLHVIPVIGNIVFSGTADGHRINLTAIVGSETQTMNLLKSDEASYQALASMIQQSAKRIQAAVAQASADRARERDALRLVDQLSSLIGQEQAFTKKATKLPGAISKIEVSYSTITAQMQIALERQQSIWGSGQAEILRGRISLGINQLMMGSRACSVLIESPNML